MRKIEMEGKVTMRWRREVNTTCDGKGNHGNMHWSQDQANSIWSIMFVFPLFIKVNYWLRGPGSDACTLAHYLNPVSSIDHHL